MNITAITAQLAQDEDGADIPIYQKNGEPYLGADGTPSTITVTGTDAQRYVAMTATVQRRMLNSRKTKLEPADLLKNRIDQASAAVLAWSGWEHDDGAAWPATPENVKTLLRTMHILEQVEAGIVGHGDFLARSAT